MEEVSILNLVSSETKKTQQMLWLWNHKYVCYVTWFDEGPSCMPCKWDNYFYFHDVGTAMLVTIGHPLGTQATSFKDLSNNSNFYLLDCLIYFYSIEMCKICYFLHRVLLCQILSLDVTTPHITLVLQGLKFAHLNLHILTNLLYSSYHDKPYKKVWLTN